MKERTPRSSVLARFSQAVEGLARTLFARSDRDARARGWEVTRTGRWGTSRVYHDPRYDRLAVRPATTANRSYRTLARPTEGHGSGAGRGPRVRNPGWDRDTGERVRGRL